VNCEGLQTKVILHHQPAADYGCAQFKQRRDQSEPERAIERERREIIHAHVFFFFILSCLVLWHMPKKPAGEIKRRGRPGPERVKLWRILN
jgi:hypothetical protein